jgi:hypothetical protein
MFACHSFRAQFQPAAKNGLNGIYTYTMLIEVNFLPSQSGKFNWKWET